MEWYLAKLVYRFHCLHQQYSTQFDEQLRLIRAEDALHAFNKAQLIGQREQDTAAGQLVQWKFINVTELHKLHEMADGAEVYSSVREEADGDTYQHQVHTKARYLLQRCTDHFLQAL